TQRLLDLAKTLNDEQLDRPLNNQVKVFPWDGPDQTLRQILDRMVQTKEAWAAALTGGGMPRLQADARNGRAATPRDEGGRFWLSHRVRRELGKRVRSVNSEITSDQSGCVANTV